MDSQEASYPDARQLATFLAERFGASKVIGFDIAAPDQAEGGDLRSADWSTERGEIGQSVAICTGVPADAGGGDGRLMRNLARLSFSALATVLVADPVRQGGGSGATASAFRQFLCEHLIEPAFVGNTSIDRASHPSKEALLAVVDRFRSHRRREPPESFRPLAVMQTYNDIDIAPQTIRKLLDDGIDVHVKDNWSTDGTHERLLEMARAGPSLTVDRFPAEGPSPHHDLLGLLRWKQEVAAQFPGRWITSFDSDEVRTSPWPGISLREGMYAADRLGFNALDFTVLDFRPCDDGFGPGDDPDALFAYFEFAHRPASFVQLKAWRQPSGDLDLLHTAGHGVDFPNLLPFPYKFIFRHYPLRSSEQAARKIFRERLPRYAPETRAKGWHFQYDHFNDSDSFLWDPKDLIDFNAPATREQYVVELISGIGILR